MKDADGRVTVAGWYDDVVPLTEAERTAVAAVPPPDAELKRDLGLARTEGGDRLLVEAIQQPSLNINGIRSADVGDKARNVIPTTASATLDLRLVKGNDQQAPGREAGPAHPGAGLHRSRPRTDAGGAAALPSIATVKRRARAIMPSGPRWTRRWPEASSRQSGARFRRGGAADARRHASALRAARAARRRQCHAELANHDNNQHAEDENLRLGNLWRAIDMPPPSCGCARLEPLGQLGKF